VAVDLHCDPFVDELTLSFGGHPVPSYSSVISGSDGGDVMVMVGLDDQDESTEEIVGIHVYPLAGGVLLVRPQWRPISQPKPPVATIAAFITDVRRLFNRSGTPAPPMAQQLSRIAAARQSAPAVPAKHDD